ncbi:MAG: hypothetical protein ACQESG_06700 [Nanobdellota archaeon]
MKRLFKLAAIGLLAANLTACSTQFSGHLAMQSRYNGRGMMYSEQAVTQAAGTVNSGPLSVTGFVNYNHEREQVDETDLTVCMTKNLENAVATAGYSYFHYPNTTFPDSQEVFGQLTAKAPFAPTVTVAYDFGDGNRFGDGLYAELSGRTQALGIELTPSIGYNQGYYREGDGFSHLEIEAAKGFTAGDITISPFMTGVKSLDRSTEDTVYGGIEISF